MRSKPVTGRAVLLELTVVLIFFSLASGVIVRLFTTGREAADESARRTDAMFIAEACAEKWLRVGVSALDEDGFIKDESGAYIASIDGFDVTARFTAEETDAGVLTTGNVTVTDASGSLVSLPLGRYEAAP